MNFIILDLEWNASYSKKNKKYINEIIEFGAVKCDEQLNILSTFSSFVCLQVGKKINTVVKELTSIKDENLDNAMPFMNVVSRFKRWCGDTVILTWGTSDITTLIENCNYFSGSNKIPFLTRYVNLQAYCESLLNNPGKGQLGLETAAKILSIDASQMEHHRALDDSLMALAIFKRLYPQNSVDPFVEDAMTNEFYRKITFKTSIISDITHPLVSQKTMLFTCEKCGSEAKRLTKWNFRNKRFISDFLCPNCNYKFSGRIQIKEKYDGLTINKKSVSLAKIEKPRVAKSCKVNNMNLDIKDNGVGLLTFDNWKDVKGIKHCFSTRIGGVSKGKYASMNLGFATGDTHENVLANYNLICSALGVSDLSLIAGNQDHQINIKRVTNEHVGTGIHRAKFTESLDALCTNEKNLALVVYAADCVPIFFYDPVTKSIALSHAGWRGTAAGMCRATVNKMVEEFNTNPSDLLVAIGPSISFNAFEVDEPCAEEFLKLEDSKDFVFNKGSGKYHVDLWKCNMKYLISAGVLEENISVGGVCSVKNSDLVFSHRVTKGQRGSNAAFLVLEDDENE